VKNTVFWHVTLHCPEFKDVQRNVLPPSSGPKNKPKQAASKRQEPRRALLVDCLGSSALKMEAVHFFETSVSFYQTTRRNIALDSTLHSSVYTYIIPRSMSECPVICPV
jgi:hypothetical protein